MSTQWQEVDCICAQDRYYVSGGIGGCVKQIGQDVPWLSAMCGYTLAPQHHEVLVIEDMLEDARCARFQQMQHRPSPSVLSRRCC